jgi:hypothetical protein
VTSPTDNPQRKNPESQQEFELKLRALSGVGWSTSPTQRLRLGLKRLLRDFGLRCTECRPWTPNSSPQQKQIELHE